MAQNKTLIILRDPTIIELASDPIQREILRLLSMRSLTQTALSALLGISASSVRYHLKVLLDAGMIRLERTNVEGHCIVQKFYHATAVHFVVDLGRVPTATKRRFLHVYMERLRGIVGLFQMVERKAGSQILINSDTIERLSEEMANRQQPSVRITIAMQENLIVKHILHLTMAKFYCNFCVMRNGVHFWKDQACLGITWRDSCKTRTRRNPR